MGPGGRDDRVQIRLSTCGPGGQRLGDRGQVRGRLQRLKLAEMILPAGRELLEGSCDPSVRLRRSLLDRRPDRLRGIPQLIHRRLKTRLERRGLVRRRASTTPRQHGAIALTFVALVDTPSTTGLGVVAAALVAVGRLDAMSLALDLSGVSDALCRAGPEHTGVAAMPLRREALAPHDTIRRTNCVREMNLSRRLGSWVGGAPSWLAPSGSGPSYEMGFGV